MTSRRAFPLVKPMLQVVGDPLVGFVLRLESFHLFDRAIGEFRMHVPLPVFELANLQDRYGVRHRPELFRSRFHGLGCCSNIGF